MVFNRFDPHGAPTGETYLSAAELKKINQEQAKNWSESCARPKVSLEKKPRAHASFSEEILPINPS